MSPGTKLAVALLALAPGRLRTIRFTEKVTGNLAFAAEAVLGLTFLSSVFTPSLIKVLLPLQSGLDRCVRMGLKKASPLPANR